MEPKKFDRFGRLTVIGNFVSQNGRKWPCRCSCGHEAMFSITDLRKRIASGTGCGKCSKGCATHGLSSSKLWGIWAGMKQRCENPNHKAYHNYGGRGISVCDRWKESFENFAKDMGKPKKGMSLDRKDTNGNYEPGNCRWADKMTQARNTRACIPVTVFGKEFSSLSEVAERYGMKSATLRARLSRGWSMEDAVSKDVGAWSR